MWAILAAAPSDRKDELPSDPDIACRLPAQLRYKPT